MDQELDSFAKALELYIERLDRAYQEIRAIAADPLFLNTEHKRYTEATKLFNETIKDIFQLKGIWYEAKKLEKKR